VEAAGTSVCLVMKAVLLSVRWAGRARRLGLKQAASAAGDGEGTSQPWDLPQRVTPVPTPSAIRDQRRWRRDACFSQIQKLFRSSPRLPSWPRTAVRRDRRRSRRGAGMASLATQALPGPCLGMPQGPRPEPAEWRRPHRSGRPLCRHWQQRPPPPTQEQLWPGGEAEPSDDAPRRRDASV
jgi:hypothetical protein